jgi:hypothetical protein
LGFRVYGSGFRVQGLGCRLWGSDPRIEEDGLAAVGVSENNVRVETVSHLVSGLVIRVSG